MAIAYVVSHCPYCTADHWLVIDPAGRAIDAYTTKTAADKRAATLNKRNRRALEAAAGGTSNG